MYFVASCKSIEEIKFYDRIPYSGLSTHPYPFQGVRRYTLFRSIIEYSLFKAKQRGLIYPIRVYLRIYTLLKVCVCIPYSSLSTNRFLFRNETRGTNTTLFGYFDASITFSRCAKVYLIQVSRRIEPFSRPKRRWD